MYKIQAITKDDEMIKYAQEVCEKMKIKFTALSELIFEGGNPHGTDQIYLIGSVYSNARLITMLRGTDAGFYLVAGNFDDGKPPSISKQYLNRKPKNRLSEEQFDKLFSECFRRWDEVFKPHGEDYGINPQRRQELKKGKVKKEEYENKTSVCKPNRCKFCGEFAIPGSDICYSC